MHRHKDITTVKSEIPLPMVEFPPIQLDSGQDPGNRQTERSLPNKPSNAFSMAAKVNELWGQPEN
jgi:hypothetical protein